MLDDDDEPSSGLGALGWYQMGRWSAEADRETEELIAIFTGTAPVARADYDYVVELYERRGARIAWFRQEIEKGNTWLREWKSCWEALKLRYDRLKDKHNQLKAEHEQLKAEDAIGRRIVRELYDEKNEMANEIAWMEEDYETLQAEYDALKESHGDIYRDFMAGRLVYRDPPGDENPPHDR
jgi:chromosome segregation ATPase